MKLLATIFLAIFGMFAFIEYSSRYKPHFWKTTYQQVKNYITNHLGWIIAILGLGIVLGFTIVFFNAGYYAHFTNISNKDLTLSDGLIARFTRSLFTKTITTAELIEFFKTAVLTIGAIGGAYALVIATRRQSELEKQTQQGQDQLFNDRLSRGVEMLSKEEMPLKVAGIKVLENLAFNSEKSEIIINIIDSYLQASTVIEWDNEDYPMISVQDIFIQNRYDVFVSAETLIRINKSLGNDTKFKKLNLNHLRFMNPLYEEIQVTALNCMFVNANFFRLDLGSSAFEFSNLTNAKLFLTNVKFCTFYVVDISNINFAMAKNLHERQLLTAYFNQAAPPTNIPSHVIKPEYNAYKWIIRDGRHYRKLVNPDPKRTQDQIKDLEQTLNRIPGGPPEDD